METKHTPGPWHRNIPPAKMYPVIFSGNNRHIAEVNIRRLTYEEIDANASLIAAAPEMLEALQKALLTISRMKLSMQVHPDCEPNSEFEDRVSEAQRVEDEIAWLIKKAATI